MGSFFEKPNYMSSIDTIALNCLVFEKVAFFFAFWRQTDRQTDEQMDSTDALSRSPCRERRLNNKRPQCNVAKCARILNLEVRSDSSCFIDVVVIETFQLTAVYRSFGFLYCWAIEITDSFASSLRPNL